MPKIWLERWSWSLEAKEWHLQETQAKSTEVLDLGDPIRWATLKVLEMESMDSSSKGSESLFGPKKTNALKVKKISDEGKGVSVVRSIWSKQGKGSSGNANFAPEINDVCNVGTILIYARSGWNSMVLNLEKHRGIFSWEAPKGRGT